MSNKREHKQKQTTIRSNAKSNAASNSALPLILGPEESTHHESLSYPWLEFEATERIFFTSVPKDEGKFALKPKEQKNNKDNKIFIDTLPPVPPTSPFCMTEKIMVKRKKTWAKLSPWVGLSMGFLAFESSYDQVGDCHIHCP